MAETWCETKEECLENPSQEEKLCPFVGELMARLLTIMDSEAAPPGVKELAVSAVGSAANAVGSGTNCIKIGLPGKLICN